MSAYHRFGFTDQRDHARRLRERRARENAITAIVIIAMLAGCIGASAMVYASWFLR